MRKRAVPIAQRARGVVTSMGLLWLLMLLSGCGQTLEITPTHTQVAAGSTLQLTAATLHALVATDVTSQVSWSSSNNAVATVSSAGVVSAVSPGTVTISASLSGSSASMSLTVTAAGLVSIEVTPANPSLPNGLSEQFTATGVFSDNSTQDLTQLVTWSSSSPAVASVSNTAGTAGLASGASVGTTTISVSSGSLSASTSLTVTAATLVSIQVTPANPTTPKGVSRQFTATGIFSDNSTQNLTTQVAWASSNSSVASISNASGSQGLASTAVVGNSTISATSGAISGSTTLTVSSATLVSIAVTPATPSIANGVTEQFTATGTYTDNSTQNLTTQVAWASSNSSVASISNASGSQGLASSAAVGSTTISATSGAISGSTTLTVSSATLVSIAVTPATPSIANGVTEQFTATGTYTDNSTQNLTTQVTWASSNTSVASISNASGSQGLASSAAVGSTTISATSGAISGNTTLTVSSATLVSIAVTPATPSIANGLTEQFTATGTYTDSSTQNLTTQVTWSSSNTAVATISNASGSQGLASSAAVGSTTISATSAVVSGSTTLTVTSATLVSIAVTPANPSIANGLTEQFTATGTYTDSSTQNLTTQVTWSSSNTAVATISNASGSQGLATSASPGSSTISAASGLISGGTTLTVTAATLVSIAVTPATPTIATATTAQFTAIGTYTDTSTQDLTTQVTWASSDTAVATISNASGSQGLASSASSGTSTISATSGSISASTLLTVSSVAFIDESNVATYTSEASAAPSTFSYNVTVGPGDDYLVFLEANNSSQATPVSVTFNGQALSLLGNQIFSFFETSIWGLANPPVGTYSFQVNYTGSPPGSPWIRVLHTVVPCAAVTSVGTVGSNADFGWTGGPQNVTVNAGSSASNGFYLGISQNYSDPNSGYGDTSGTLTTNGTGQTNLASLVITDSVTTHTYVDVDQIPSSDAGAFSWSTGDSQLGWVASAVAIN